MYKLYKNNKGRVTQVPVAQNDPEEDLFFPDPLEAKGNVPDVAPFVLQEKKQFDLIKQNETQQARFQTKKLQNNNYQILNFEITPTDSTASQGFYNNEYNQAVAVGTPLDSGVLFGTNTADVTKAKYYNIVYANVRFNQAISSSSQFVLNPSFLEFYPMQKLPTGDFGGKIPRQIEAVANSVNTFGITVDGAEYGVQSFGLDLESENVYYSQSDDVKGIRCCGLALKTIQLNFNGNFTLSGIKLNVEIGYDLNTEGNNY